MLIWPDDKNTKKLEDKPKVKSGAIPPLPIGVLTGFVMILFYSIVQVLTRKMKAVHFSIVQFNYGFFASSCMLMFLIGEYVVKRNDKENYPYERLRLFSYDYKQWMCLLALSALNYPLQLS